MEKIQKLFDVFVASDNTEFFSEFECTQHEEKLLNEKALSEQQERNRLTLEAHALLVEAAAQRWVEHPEEELAFKEKMRNDIQEGMEAGVRCGWWPAFNERGPIPWPDVFVISTREIRQNNKKPDWSWETTVVLEERENTMAHLLAKLKIFESIGEARKNGWNKPIVAGDFWFQKKTKHVQIVEE